MADQRAVEVAAAIADIARDPAIGACAAVVLRDEEISFAELDRRAGKVASRLTDECGSGQAIAFLSQSSPLIFEILLGTARSSNVFLPLNWRLSVPELREIVRLSAPTLLFADEVYRDAALALQASATTPLRVVLLRGDDSSDTEYAAWREALTEHDARTPAPETEAMRLYTSGTTGLPKGVRLSHGNFAAIFDCFPKIGLDYRAGRVLMPLPLFHVAGLAISLHTLASGGCVVLASEAKGQTLLDLIEKHHITDAFLVPAILLGVVQVSQSRASDLSFVRTIAYGAAPVSEELLKQASALFGCNFIQLYGLTETTGTATYLPASDHGGGKDLLRSCGKPSPNVQIRVVTDKGVAEAGAVGEVQIRGPNVTPGYWNDDEATARAFTDGWFKTGDAGYFDAAGYLFLHDRIKDMIVSGGENVYPAEVENAIFGHPDVADVAVIGVPDPKWGEAVMAIVVLKEGRATVPQAIIDWARDRIAGYKLPKTVIFRDDLPRTPSGKILKRDLRAPFWGTQGRQIN